MTVAVVIPWRDTGCEHRRAALNWVLRCWTAAYRWPVTVATDHPSPVWSKGVAVRRGVDRVGEEADVVVIADADVWPDDSLEGIAGRVASREIPWARPFNRVARLTERATGRVLAGEDLSTVGRERASWVRRPYHHRAAGGVLILRRDDTRTIPLDPRFLGHAGEDFAWAEALDLLVGRRIETEGLLFHLWHPPADHIASGFSSEANAKLRDRYQRARRNPEAMKMLIAEVIGAGPCGHLVP